MGYPSPLKNRSKSFSLSVWRSQSLPAFRNQLGTAAVRMSGQISPRCENMRGIKTCIPTICNGCKMDIHIHWCTVTLTKTHMWWKNPGKEKTSLQKHPSRNHLNDFFFLNAKKKVKKGHTVWSTTVAVAFFATMSRMFRKRCEQRWRQALSTRKDMFSAHSWWMHRNSHEV